MPIRRFRVIFTLFILMGLNGLMEFIKFFVHGDDKLWIVTDIVNPLTGMMVFILLICKRTVWNRLKKRFPCLEKLHVAICQHRDPSWITQLFRSQGNNKSSTGSNDAQVNINQRIQETAPNTTTGAPQLRDDFDVRVDMTL